jgi:hypothetical protein
LLVAPVDFAVKDIVPLEAEAVARPPPLMLLARREAMLLVVSPWPKLVLYEVPLIVTEHVPES